MRTTIRFLTISPLALGLGLAVSCTEESDDDGNNDNGGTGGEVSLETGGTSNDGGGGATGTGGESTDICDTSDFASLAGCGWTTSTARLKTPALLFVIDKSGSMSDEIEGPDSGSPAKWTGLYTALEDALGTVDPDMGLGLIMYPHNVQNPIPDSCNDIAVCCEVPEGDAAVLVDMTPGETGARQVLGALEAVAPAGGTPTAVALERAKEYYLNGAGANWEGEKYVLLATDGGPNCNTAISCNAETCTTNIEGRCLEGNCCENAGDRCVDDRAVLTQIQALDAAGVQTFVVGIPGTEVYASFLNEFALAGGVPNPDGGTSYYAVEAAAGVEGLTQVFRDISTQLVKSCDIELAEKPVNPEQVNVAIDCELIPETGLDADGNDVLNWEIDYESTPGMLHLLGDTCERVQTEGAKQVDVVMGCPKIT
jgi:hypothetical protein